ncbi:PAS domain-containing protein [Nisaea sp.]|uniref:PAS domain-containing protein n=1 Tax=Nisaea sp. TaxID=2024842 RepID=UPI0032EBB784
MEIQKDILVPISDLVPPDASTLHHRFLGHWLALRGDRAMPSFADLDPVDIPWALAHIFVVDILPGDDFVYRITGDNHTQRYGRNLKGARITDIMKAEGATAILKRWREVRDRPAGFFVVTDHMSTQGFHVLGERMVLPFANDGVTPSHLVGITNFVSETSLATGLVGDQRVRLFRWSHIEHPSKTAE